VPVWTKLYRAWPSAVSLIHAGLRRLSSPYREPDKEHGGYLQPWRKLRNPVDWSVTGVTQRLLEHWRHHDFAPATATAAAIPSIFPKGNRRCRSSADRQCSMGAARRRRSPHQRAAQAWDERIGSARVQAKN